MQIRISLLMLFLFVPNFGQADPPDLIRVRYEKTDAIPDKTFLRQFLRAATRHDGRDAHAEQHGISIIQSRMHFATNDAAQEFYEFLVQLKSEMGAEHKISRRQLLCQFDVPRPTGPQVYQVLDMLDDRWDSLGQAYLQRIRRELGPESYQHFKVWMDELKLQTTLIRFNHAIANKDSDPDIVRQNLCGRFDANNPDF